MDALESVLDEVALEGLDGISVNALWTRLENRIPQFSLTLDPPTKEYLWRCLVCNPEISFYELPQARKPIVLTDRFAEIDPETGIQEIRRLTLDADDAVYPVHIIQDNKDGIQGSCLYFKERKVITKQIRQDNFTPILTLEQTVSKWGEKLVAVASQAVRYRTLIGPEGDPELKLTDTSYCILERLGRARWQGELQRDLHSNTFKVDARKMHYLRRSLDRNKMITMQTHVIRMANGGQQCSILLLLNRFHVDRRGKYDILMECTSNILSTQPNNIGIMLKLRHQLHVSERTFKRVYHYMVAAKLVEVISLPLHQITPGAGPLKSKKGNDIMVRCLKLLKAYGKKKEDDDDEDNDDDDNDGRNFLAEGRDVERDVASHAYEIVVNAGTKGISQSELRKRLNIGKLEARMICRLLDRNDMIKGFMEDEGRQRTTKYISKQFVEQSELKKQYTKEKERSEQLYGGTAGHAHAHAPAAAKSAAPRPAAAAARQATPKSAAPKAAAAKRKKVAAEKEVATQEEKEDEEEEEEEELDALDAEREREEPRKVPEPEPESRESQEEETGTGAGAVEEEEDEPAGGKKGRKKAKGKGPAKAKGKGQGKGKKARQEDQAVGGTEGTPCRQTKLSFARASCSTPQSDKTLSPSINLVGDETLAYLEQEVGAEELDQSDLTMDTSAAPVPTPGHSFSQSPSPGESVTLVEEVLEPKLKLPDKGSRAKEKKNVTYRLLKRKNIIIETVRSLKIIENIFTLQKMLIESERADGVSTKVCKKSIVRLVRSLSREGQLRLYRTTVIQDGISKRVEFVVHPSITPDDPLIKSAIEQVRFRISGSYSALRLRALDEKQEKKEEKPKPPSKPPHKLDQKMGIMPLKDFRPAVVPGYGRALGFQPKMPRLRMVHTFIWYVVYGHPLSPLRSAEACEPDPEVNKSVQEAMAGPSGLGQGVEADAQEPVTGAQEAAPSSTAQDVTSNEQEAASEDMRVYVDEINWKRYVPPLPVHKEFGPGWALTSDILISLPLSLLIQIIHISFKVDGLEEYVNDPVKKHYLVRFLPSAMKRQLLYKRKYVFSFYESLERLCSMGLMQFGPMEKFQEKDQMFVCLKRYATITDTTTCEPHYNLAKSARPFERRRYHFLAAQDVDSYWFDLLCVCLNTPLGLIRLHAAEGEDTVEREKPDPHKYPRIRHSLPRSREVIDDGVTPGDGLGAGGLDSEFYAHLKRNWIWNCHLIDKTAKDNPITLQTSPSVRLRNLLNKHLLSKNVIAVSDRSSPNHAKLLLPQVVEEEVQVALEPSSRSLQNRGGRQQKRKRLRKTPAAAATSSAKKKEKKEKKPKKPMVRQFLDKTDRDALQRMTRKRVAWCQQEDSLLMLCRVACHFLNRKIKKAFVPWQVVRDLLHAEFEASLDKTSHAVGRRARYIMKNPQTYLNFKICLAEVYQDKSLVAEFNNRTGDYNNPQVCTEEFKEFVAVLRRKFSKAPGCRIEIPDTKQELFQRFKVYAIGDESPGESKDVLKSEEDIHALVLNNFIQSTLAVSNHQLKTKLSFQTFHLYSRYKHEILYEAFLKCQRNGLVNRRRNEQRYGVKKDRSLPMMPMSYQLSQSYYKVFTWRFPAAMFTEAYDHLEKLIQAGGVDQPNAIYVQPKESEQEKERAGEEEAAAAVAEVKKRAEEEKDKQMETEEEDEMRKEGADPPADTQEKAPSETPGGASLTPGPESGSGSGSGAPRQPPSENPSQPDMLLSAENLEGMALFPLDAPGGACMACLSLITLGLLAVDVSIPEQIVVVDSNMLDSEVVKRLAKEVEEEDELDEEEEAGQTLPLRKRVEVKASQASHTNYLLMRGYCMPGVLSSRLKVTSVDSVVVNACTVHVRLRNTPAHTLFKEKDSPILSDCLRPGLREVPERFTRVYRAEGSAALALSRRLEAELGYGAADVSAALEVWWHVDEAQSYGVDRRHLLASYSHLVRPDQERKAGLQQYIEDLVLLQELVEAGGRAVRLVSRRVARPWLLHSVRVRPQPGQASAHALHALRALRLPEWRQEQRQKEREKERQRLRQEEVQQRQQGRQGRQGRLRGGVEEQLVKEKMEEMEEMVGEEGSGGERRRKRKEEEDKERMGPPPRKRMAKEKGVKVSWLEALGKGVGSGGVSIETEMLEDAGIGEGGGGQQKEASWMERVDKGGVSDGDLSAWAGLEKEGLAGTMDGGASSTCVDDKLRTELEDAAGCLSPSEKQSIDHISFLSRPWRAVDGSVNRSVCKGILEGLLHHVMSRPGITEPQLIQHYTRVLQPVTIIDLMQTLVEQGCVRRRYLLPAARASLFSAPRYAEVRGEEVAACLGYTPFYEPTPEAGLLMSKAFPHEKNWNHWSALQNQYLKQQQQRTTERGGGNGGAEGVAEVAAEVVTEGVAEGEA
ncbi:general transcription factor 3C polypeptide 1 [Sardina pilchardus]|uniref:general transcription factor 3C polypeptide 1 n=1 Tax=Sardina pilchardus TaxID=27697 RepID=UPI002E1543D9